MFRKSRKYMAIAALSALADAVYTLSIWAVAKDFVWLALFTGSTIPFLNLMSSICFVEAKTRKEQLYVTTAISLGMFIGGAIALFAVR